jgi:hypothetical protein
MGWCLTHTSLPVFEIVNRSYRIVLPCVHFGTCTVNNQQWPSPHTEDYFMFTVPILGSLVSIGKYCHVFQWLRRGFGSANRFIGSSLVVTTVSSYTLKITVTTAHVTSHTKSSNSSSGHTAVPLELRNSSEVNSHSRILSYPRHGPRTENTGPLLLRSADHTENKSRDNYLASPLARSLLPSNEL